MKNSNRATHIVLRLTPAESNAAARALDFLMHSDDLSFEEIRKYEDCAWDATEKLDANEQRFAPDELTITVRAIDVTIRCLSGAPSLYAGVEAAFPELIPDLREALPLLRELLPRLRAKAAQS